MRLGNVIDINPESIRKDYSFSEIEYIDISSMGSGVLQCTQRMKIENAPSRAKRIVRNGDTLLSTVRPNLRSFWFARNTQKNTIASTGFAVLRARNDIDARYLYFVVTNQPFTDYLTANAKGAAYPAVDTDTIQRADICLPPLSTQQNISAILSAYDDLIDNNLQRIKILEEMAQNLYSEWFVKFRFPGYQHTHFIESPIGLIPEGWEINILGEILVLNYGKALKQEERRGGDVPVYGSSGVVGFHDVPLVNGPGIIVGRKGNVGSIFWSDEGFYPIDTAYFVTSKLPLRFLFYDLQTKNFLNNDAAVPGLNRNQAYSLNTIIPSTDILTQFCKLADYFGQQVSILRRKNTILSRTIALLQPKLISGELDISQIDIIAPSEATT